MVDSYVSRARDAGPRASDLTAADALCRLLHCLKARGYNFVTTTPASHARVLARDRDRIADDLRDIFGWGLPFEESVVDREIMALLMAADAVRRDPRGRWRCRYRVSSLDDFLLLHSAFPTSERDAVFFGPDSYRFAAFIRQELEHRPMARGGTCVDIGAGTSAGALVAAASSSELSLVMTDINAEALRLAEINARAAGAQAALLMSDSLDGVAGAVDLALANPPYIVDPAGPRYRDGGAMHGMEVALDMARMAIGKLAPGGRLLLYTGSAIVDGQDRLFQSLVDLVSRTGDALRYREIDPDVFGEELDGEAYRDVDRIAVVGAVVERNAQRRMPASDAAPL